MKPRELNIFLNAILYYTRIRVPKSVECSEKSLSSAFRYFPLVGYIVGGAGALVFYGASYFLPTAVCVIFAIMTIMLLTGGFHEDGVADFCDGFGAGRDKEAILRIMKDSHIGTYGVIGLIVLLSLKFTLITAIEAGLIPMVIMIAQGSSRFLSVLVVRVSQYARAENSKAMHTKLGVSIATLLVAMLFAWLPILYFGWHFALLYIVASLVLFWLFRHYLHHKIGGFTGDTLGMLQQMAELLFYMLFIALCLR